MNGSVAMPILPCQPLHTCFALGTGRTLLIPINHELCCRVPILTACLPAAIRCRWAEQIDVSVTRTRQQVIRRDIASIDDMLTRCQLPCDQVVLNCGGDVEIAGCGWRCGDIR